MFNILTIDKKQVSRLLAVATVQFLQEQSGLALHGRWGDYTSALIDGLLPMCSPQESQYSAYRDSKQVQQYGRPSFMM